MNRSIVLSVSLCGALFAGATLVASTRTGVVLTAQAPTQAAAETLSAEDLAARTTFEAVCSTCHESAVATTTFRTRAEWNEVFDLMVSFGATATDAQFMQIQRYLGRRYGRVNLNRAPADELQFVLDITPEVAQAIIDYRATMRVTSAEDLRNIAGLPAARIELLKPHLQF